jgi:hypothetical protein
MRALARIDKGFYATVQDDPWLRVFRTFRVFRVPRFHDASARADPSELSAVFAWFVGFVVRFLVFLAQSPDVSLGRQAPRTVFRDVEARGHLH